MGAFYCLSSGHRTGQTGAKRPKNALVKFPAAVFLYHVVYHGKKLLKKRIEKQCFN
jgi:hypothetical protein